MLVLQRGFASFGETKYQTIHIASHPKDALPTDLNSIIDMPPGIDSQQGIIIPSSPVWLSIFLYEKLRLLPWIAIQDARFGAVVCASNSSAFPVGQILSLDKK